MCHSKWRGIWSYFRCVHRCIFNSRSRSHHQLGPDGEMYRFKRDICIVFFKEMFMLESQRSSERTKVPVRNLFYLCMFIFNVIECASKFTINLQPCFVTGVVIP